MPALLIGTIDQISEDVRARRARLDLSYSSSPTATWSQLLRW
jgi:hypothetical protein